MADGHIMGANELLGKFLASIKIAAIVAYWLN